MIKVDITEKQLERAKVLYNFYNLNHSITSGKSQLWGALGEIIVHDFFDNKGKRVSLCSTYNYDMIMEGSFYEIKTKKVGSYPLPNYNCSISRHNMRQKCDFYIFTRIMNDLKIGYILGYISKKSFSDICFHLSIGQLDDRFTVKDDCYNVRIKDLLNIEDI